MRRPRRLSTDWNDSSDGALFRMWAALVQVVIWSLIGLNHLRDDRDRIMWLEWGLAALQVGLAVYSYRDFRVRARREAEQDSRR